MKLGLGHLQDYGLPVRAWGLVLLLCLAGLLGCKQAPPPTVQELVASAELAQDYDGLDEVLELYAKAIAIAPQDPTIYASRANCYWWWDEDDKAFADMDLAIALSQANTAPAASGTLVDLYAERSSMYHELDRYDEAVKDITAALELTQDKRWSPADWSRSDVYSYYANLLLDTGKAREAIVLYEKSIADDPEDVDSRNYLAWMLATHADAAIRDPARALVLAQDACELSQWNDLYVIDTLAAALAANGNFAKAIEHQIHCVQAANGVWMLDEFRGRLNLYRQGKPYIERDDQGEASLEPLSPAKQSLSDKLESLFAE